MPALALQRPDPSFNPKKNLQSGEILNSFEFTMLELLASLLGNQYLYCPQIPLEVICHRLENHRLPQEDWQLLVSSRVDIALIDRTLGTDRQAKLVLECQSHFHDQLATQARDRRKAKFLSAASVPLIYVRYIDNDSRFYRFYTPNDSQEVFYNLATQEGRQEVSAWLRSQMIKHR